MEKIPRIQRNGEKLNLIWCFIAQRYYHPDCGLGKIFSNALKMLKNNNELIEYWKENDSIIVPITSFAPEPLEVIKEINVVVQKDEDEFTATFFDANIGTTGCNQTEAIDNLKELIVSRYYYLNEQPQQTLGPALVKQLTVLNQFISKSPTSR